MQMNWQWPGPAWCLYHLRGSKHPGYRKHILGSLNPFSLSTWEFANLPLTFYVNIKTIPLISRVLEDFRKQLFLWRLKREHSSSQLVFQTEIKSLMPTAGPPKKGIKDLSYRLRLTIVGPAPLILHFLIKTEL